MAKRRAKKFSGQRSLLLALGLVLVLVAGFFAYRHLDGFARLATHDKSPIKATADRIDPANDERHVAVTGLLASGGAVRDSQLGVSARAAALWRETEMLQWQEHCNGENCSYDKVWSQSAID